MIVCRKVLELKLTRLDLRKIEEVSHISGMISFETSIQNMSINFLNTNRCLEVPLYNQRNVVVNCRNK